MSGVQMDIPGCLDTIASNIESSRPDIALELDRISDRLEDRTASGKNTKEVMDAIFKNLANNAKKAPKFKKAGDDSWWGDSPDPFSGGNLKPSQVDLSRYNQDKMLPMMIKTFYVPKDHPKRTWAINQLAEMEALSDTGDLDFNLIEAVMRNFFKSIFEEVDKAKKIPDGKQLLNRLQSIVKSKI